MSSVAERERVASSTYTVTDVQLVVAANDAEKLWETSFNHTSVLCNNGKRAMKNDPIFMIFLRDNL